MTDTAAVRVLREEGYNRSLAGSVSTCETRHSCLCRTRKSTRWPGWLSNCMRWGN